MARYRDRVRAIVDEVRARAGGASFSEIDDLVDHDEPVEAVLQLAWLIVEERVGVPLHVVVEIRRLVESWEEKDFLPADLDRLAQVDDPEPGGSER